MALCFLRGVKNGERDEGVAERGVVEGLTWRAAKWWRYGHRGTSYGGRNGSGIGISWHRYKQWLLFLALHKRRSYVTVVLDKYSYLIRVETFCRTPGFFFNNVVWRSTWQQEE